MTISAGLESSEPQFLWANAVEPVVLRGWAYHPRVAMADAFAHLDEHVVPSVAVGIERQDIDARYQTTPRRSAHARWSGYILAGLVGPSPAGAARLDVSLVTEDGERHPAGHRDVAVRRFPRRPIEAATGSPQVGVAMATFEPAPELFSVQVESIRAQTHDSWLCVISDDGSSPACRAEMRRILADDARFVLVEHEERLGFYRNFERALTLVPDDVAYVALADQDDRWFPHKIERLVRRLEADHAVQLVASDACLMEPQGVTLSRTFYEHRVPTHDDPYSLFVVNSLIGASMLFRHELLDIALPFPRAFPNAYHDHWLARVALVLGQIAFEPEPLYGYVQHGGNVLGSRPASQWPMRAMCRPYVRSFLRGADNRLPVAWAGHFLENVVEPRLAADLLRARWPPAAGLRWMDRIRADASYAEIVHILLDHLQESRAPRLRREHVELVLFSGRAWAMQHQPTER